MEREKIHSREEEHQPAAAAACNMRVWADWSGLQDSLPAAVGTQCVPWLLPKY